MFRMDIVGLTLAEVTLVLLFSLMAIFVPQQGAQENDAKVLQQKIKNLQQNESALKQQVASLEREIQQLRKRFESPRPDLRSKATPTCFEIDRTDWLFSVTIHGSDSFEIAGKMMTLDDILNTYKEQMRTAKTKGCIHRVQVFYGREISTAEYDTALRRLEGWFSTAKRGPAL